MQIVTHEWTWVTPPDMLRREFLMNEASYGHGGSSCSLKLALIAGGGRCPCLLELLKVCFHLEGEKIR